MNLLDPIVAVEVLCLLFAIIFLIKDKNYFWRTALGYIFLVCATEIYGSYLSTRSINNLWLYNIFILFESSFVSLGMFYCLKKYINPKPIIFTGLAIIYIVYIIVFFVNGWHEFNSLTVTVMSVVFVIYSLYYYFLLLKDENFIDIKYHPEFWWVAGVLFFYFASTISNLLYDVFQIKIIENLSLRYIIYIFLNAILYTIWTYSFICRAKQRRLQSL